jgi:hypothetical protein
MLFLRALIFGAARRLATDPAARAKAAQLARPAVKATVREARTIRAAPDPAREAGRLAARLKRRYLDGER